MSHVTKLLPPGVVEKNGRYFLPKWIPAERRTRWHPLSRKTEGFAELYRQLALLDPTFKSNTLAAIFADFEASRAFGKLATETRRQYSMYYRGLLGHRFGHMVPHELEQHHVAAFLAECEEKGSVSRNRAMAALSSAYNHGMRRCGVKFNPCRGIRRNPEHPDRTEIPSATLSAGIDKAPAHFARPMQFGYLTGVRKEDIILLELTALTPRGIEFTESKTKKPVVIEWTPALRELIREILEARHAAMTRQYSNKYRKPRALPEHDRLFVNRFGQPLTAWGMQSNMRRLEVDFTFRQIRPKAETDGSKRGRNVLGHEGQMRRRYNRRLKLTPVR